MGVAQIFVGKIFVHRLQTTKSTKILPLENYPLYGMYCITCNSSFVLHTAANNLLNENLLLILRYLLPNNYLANSVKAIVLHVVSVLST